MRFEAPAKRRPWKRKWLELVAVKPLSVAVSPGAERIVRKCPRRRPWIVSRGYEPRRTSTVAPDGAPATARSSEHQGVCGAVAALAGRASSHAPPIESLST